MINLPDSKGLSVAERILYVEDIWDSIVAEEHSLEATKAQREELDRRISAHEKTPDAVSAWDEVKSRLRSLK